MSDSGDGYIDFRLYRYDPNMGAAVLFVILFAAITALHFYQMIRTKTYFFVPFVIGGLFEVVGYAGVGTWTPMIQYRLLTLLSASRV